MELLQSVWQRQRERECARMRAFPVDYNVLSDASVRANSAVLFDWTGHAPCVHTWRSLCAELPEAQRVLEQVELDADLVACLRAEHPHSTAPLYTLLDEDQRVALVMIVAGYNVFLTGSAGAGKSKIVNSAVATLRKVLGALEKDLLVCGTTGVASFNIGGLTAHHALALHVADPAKYRRMLGKRMVTLGALLVDEISMMSPNDFYRMHMHMCGPLLHERDPLVSKLGALPFGGRQVILVGDYFQLSHVHREFTGVDSLQRAEDARVRELAEFQHYSGEAKCFTRWGRAFCTPLWAQAFAAAVQLDTLHRQSDGEFMKFLTDVRWGDLNQRAAMRFVAPRTIGSDDVPESAMFLFATNKEANDHNVSKLAKLPGPDIVFSMIQRGRKCDDDPLAREQCDGALPVHRAQATLRLGARARLWSNFDVERGIVNGTQCELVGLVPIGAVSVSHQNKPRTVAPMANSPDDARRAFADSLLRVDRSGRTQYTLLNSSAFELAWTGDNDSVELIMKSGNSSVYQADGEHPLSLDAADSTVHKYSRAEGATRGRYLDYGEHHTNATRSFCVAVRFFHLDHHEIFILPPVLSTRTEQVAGKERPLISQMQIPLIAGYGCTVHAAQGLTLDAVAIDVSRRLDPALAYVALTRARNADLVYFVGESGLHNSRPDGNVVALSRLLTRQKGNVQ